MKLTNKYNLPDTLYEAVKADPYKGGGFISTTKLIDAPQIRILQKVYKDELEEDVSDMLWALMGSAVHHILERANIKDVRKSAFLTTIEVIRDEANKRSGTDKDALLVLAKKIEQLVGVFFPEIAGRYIFEIRLTYTYRGKDLTGAFDLFDTWTNTLYDYKMCSVYAYIFPESRKKWSAQTNIYAFMLREQGYTVDNIKIVALFRDFQKVKADFNTGDYPTQQCMTIEINVVDNERMRKYIHTRMDMHIDAEESGILPECTGEDRWAKSDEYAVKKKGSAKALRVLTSLPMATDFVEKNKHRYDKEIKIFFRPGENKRCESYCQVSNFCKQKKENDQRIKKLENERNEN